MLPRMHAPPFAHVAAVLTVTDAEAYEPSPPPTTLAVFVSDAPASDATVTATAIAA